MTGIAWPPKPRGSGLLPLLMATSGAIHVADRVMLAIRIRRGTDQMSALRAAIARGLANSIGRPAWSESLDSVSPRAPCGVITSERGIDVIGTSYELAAAGHQRELVTAAVLLGSRSQVAAWRTDSGSSRTREPSITGTSDEGCM